MAATRSTRLLSVLLVAHQLGYGVPARAAVDLQAGKPLDSPALGDPGGTGTSPLLTPDLFTGGAAFALPIVVPPGTGGLAPVVRLRYDASRRDGPLGVGWGLGVGFPLQIARSTRDGAPEYDDALDDFELDGRRLRATASSGVYATEHADHTRVEDRGTHWLVLRPDGTRLYYGYHAGEGSPPDQNESRLDSEQVLSSAPTVFSCPTLEPCSDKEEVIPAGIPFAWHLDRVEDRNGNVIRLRWQSLGDPGARYLTRIDYSEHVAGSPDSLPGFGGSDDGTLASGRAVVFGYETRPDVLPTYRTGFRRELRHRLADISSEVDGARVRHYVLGYAQSPASGRSRLVSVEERGADDDPATAFVHGFGYTEGGTAGWTGPDPLYALPEGLAFVDSVLGDPMDTGLRLVDVNSDGYTDLVQARNLIGPVRNTYLGGPAGFADTPSPEWAPPWDFADLAGFTGLVFGDFDGDTRPDLMLRRLFDTGFNEANPVNAPCTEGASAELENGFMSQAAWTNDGLGWAQAPEHQFEGFQLIADRIDTGASQGTYPFSQSCPQERFPTATLHGGFDSDTPDESFDRSVRVVDVNGDGLDDLVSKRSPASLQWDYVELSAQFSTYTGVVTVEGRQGVLLNGPLGLEEGVLSSFHQGLSFAQDPADPTGPFLGFSSFEKLYFANRWQFPQQFAGVPDSLLSWSQFRHCLAFPDVQTLDLLVSVVDSGLERFADVNGDGLVDVLEGFDEDELPQTPVQNALINDGYNWQLATQLPESAAAPPDPFVDLDTTSLEIAAPFGTEFANSECVETEPGGGSDRGWRVVDVNGDGGPDLIGGPANEVLLWDATAPAGSLWRAEPGWTLPPGIGFATGSSEDPAVRLADVNADGLVDIMVDDGAYLNLAQPPDRLETVSSPFGAVTTFSYAPSTDFEVPPTSNPTVDGQMRMPRPVWVVSQVETDPGFGEPPLVRQFAYRDPVYDIDDRAFRGFGTVEIVGPTATYAEAGTVRPATEIHFHTSDALAGEVARVEVFDDVTGAPLRASHFEYAHASGADTDVTVTASDFSTTTLAPGDPQQAAFADFFARFDAGGSPVAGAEGAFLRFPVVAEERLQDGSEPDAVSRVERVFDAYGNPVEVRGLGDPGDAGDDVTSVLTYAIRDEADLLLANRPASVVTSGTSGPPGTTLERETHVFYDDEPGLGAVVRGNPTRVERRWGATWLATTRVFDAYGNLLEQTLPQDVASPDPLTVTRIVYDPAFRTFPVSVTRAADTALALTTTLEYELSGCGGPPGMGLPCRSTGPNGHPTEVVYDAFGRAVERTGPNGFAQAILYHDADRATASQRTELRLRWDPTAGPPASDPNAIASEVFFDGLGRTLRATRPGPGSLVAERSTAYDAAGRVASATRWEFGGGGPATLLEYDALGRPTRQTLPDGTFTRVTYDRRDTTVEDHLPGEGLAHKRLVHRDGRGRLAEVHEWADPDGGSPAVTSYGYDPFGGLAEVYDAMANDPSLCGGDAICEGQTHATYVFYDELGNRVRLEDPDAGVWLSSFDARGRLDLLTDPRGITIDHEYDELNRLRQRIPPEPEPIEELTYGLAGTPVPNGVGRLVRVDDAEGHDAFEYDAAGNVAFHTRTAIGQRFDFTHTYDPLGRRIETAYPDGETVTWHHDQRLLVRISSAGGDYPDDYVGSVDYDPLDRVTSLELGGAGGSAPVTETRSYDPVTARLDRIQAVHAQVGTIADLDYTIDGLGRVRANATQTRLPGSGGVLESRSFGYAYDGLDRLAEATGAFQADATATQTLAYAYDALGNLLQKDHAGDGTGFATLVYDDPERPRVLSQALDDGGTLQRMLAYDEAGHVTAKDVWDGAAFQTTALSYDAFGRPVAVGGETQGWAATGRRVRLTQGGQDLLFPAPDYEYLDDGNRVNKHFFVAGRRVASSERTWAAPAASAPPVRPGPGWRALPDADPEHLLGVLYGLLALALLGAALWRRPDEPAGALRWRLLAVTVVLLVTPALLGGRRRRGSPPSLGTHTFAGLFYVTDRLGSTVVAANPSAVQARFVYRPFGDGAVAEGTDLHHRFTGEPLDPAGVYALGVRSYVTA